MDEPDEGGRFGRDWPEGLAIRTWQLRRRTIYKLLHISTAACLTYRSSYPHTHTVARNTRNAFINEGALAALPIAGHHSGARAQFTATITTTKDSGAKVLSNTLYSSFIYQRRGWRQCVGNLASRRGEGTQGLVCISAIAQFQ